MLVRDEGFEPPTSSMSQKYSTAELITLLVSPGGGLSMIVFELMTYIGVPGRTLTSTPIANGRFDDEDLVVRLLSY